MLVSLASAACATTPELEEEIESELAPTYKAQVKNGKLSITGNSAASKLTLRLGATTTILEVDVGDDGSADFTFDRSTFDRIGIDAGGGDDFVRMHEVLGAFTLEEQITINGGGGNDTIIGGVGPETLLGGSGNDTVAGHFGADTVSLGAGDDTFIWDLGGSSDVVEGDDGTDTLVFNASNANDVIELSANDDRLRLTRNIASVAMDLDGLEIIELHPKGGADAIVVHDLTAALVAQVNVDLSVAVPEGDAQADLVTIDGTPAADIVDVGLDGTAVAVTGLATEVRVSGGEPTLDRLIVNGDAADRLNINGTPAADAMNISVDPSGPAFDGGGFTILVAPGAISSVTVNGFGGDDVITTGGVVTPLILDGGDGDDRIVGGFGADLLRGGAGNDTLRGGASPDTVFLGEGDDTFLWSPGDSSDVVEGEAGSDALIFSTSGANDTIDLHANGSRVSVFRNIASTTTDLDGIERIDVHTLNGSDIVVVNPLTGTSAARVNVDLGAFLGGSIGDTQPDTVVVNGAPGSHTIEVQAEGNAVTAVGLGATVSVVNGEPAIDRMAVHGGTLDVNGTPAADTMRIVPDANFAALYDGGGFNVLVAPGAVGAVTVRGHGGDDSIKPMGSIVTPLILDGGEGNDTLTGGLGADRLLGGLGNDTVDGSRGDDTALLGDGDDTYLWHPGDSSDVIDGALGADALLFQASNANDSLELRADGSHAKVFRNIGTTTTDLASVERIDLIALGGSDVVLVGDLTGTPVTQVTVELAPFSGSTTGDALPDLVTVLGSPAADSIAVAADAGAVVVSGLTATVRITHPDVSDQLAVHGQGGVDTILAASGLEALITLLTFQD
jgi:Ca2+-binding RTX toxin-like protein